MKQAMLLTVNSLLLISLKSIFLAVVFIQVVRCSYFSIIPGSVLFDHVLSTHSVESSLICGQHCLRNKLCLSFNLRTIQSRNTMFLCELSASDTKMSPTNLHKHSDYEYFEYKVSWICKRIVRCKGHLKILFTRADQSTSITSLIPYIYWEQKMTDTLLSWLREEWTRISLQIKAWEHIW